ncbi:MAG: glutathione synthase [Gemmatimonadota bacterium]
MSAGLQILFVIDPLEALILETETSLLLMSEAARRGHAPWITYLRELYLQDSMARTRARPIAIDESVRPFYRLGLAEDRAVDSFDVVLMRKDPPVDVDYHNALAILARARERVPVLNDPVGMCRSNEKLLPLEIPGAAPPSVVTADPEVAAAFVREHGDVVVKPLNEYSGHGIRRVRVPESAFDSGILESLAAQPGRHVLLQRFLSEVAKGDKRVLVLDGEALGWVNRIPRPGSFYANIHQGAVVEATDLTERERELIRGAAPLMAERGLEMTGFDFIGGWLTEINFTSPSALRQIDQVMKNRLETRVVDYLERRAAEGVRRTLPV